MVLPVCLRHFVWTLPERFRMVQDVTNYHKMFVTTSSKFCHTSGAIFFSYPILHFRLFICIVHMCNHMQMAQFRFSHRVQISRCHVHSGKSNGSWFNLYSLKIPLIFIFVVRRCKQVFNIPNFAENSFQILLWIQLLNVFFLSEFFDHVSKRMRMTSMV